MTERSKVEVIADEIGPSLRWATAQVTKNERKGPGGERRVEGCSRRRPRPRIRLRDARSGRLRLRTTTLVSRLGSQLSDLLK